LKPETSVMSYGQFGVPDCFVVSMGSAEPYIPIWKGFKELQALRNIDKLPRMIGVQAHGCAPIAEAHLKNTSKPVAISKPSTHALGILVSNPLNGKGALQAIKESKGAAITVQDSEIFVAEQEIARLEGIFAEPSSSATIAALKKLVDQGVIDKKTRLCA